MIPMLIFMNGLIANIIIYARYTTKPNQAKPTGKLYLCNAVSVIGALLIFGTNTSPVTLLINVIGMSLVIGVVIIGHKMLLKQKQSEITKSNQK